MANDALFGLHDDALRLRARRAELLSDNIANADTPHYKARDLDFRAALKQADSGAGDLTVSNHRHIGSVIGTSEAEALYREPHGAALDGNTVEAEQEMAKFGENAVQYQTTLTFLRLRVNGMLSALKGE